ncbi:MAG: glutamine synthetase III [Lachnospiraceae bacterium]|nr:glutamine synthetase III [Lachnospiraceae bacterium]MBR4816947.1 glutamine synthetase III [Lachnospiraceae bacterium]
MDLTQYFGVNTFNDNVMKERLPLQVYRALKKTIENGEELSGEIADVVANAMKQWAIERGATHFTHWFQPMTGVTAEKHDSFLAVADNGRVMMEFSGKELIKGEPDASSFPSGGLRATFEARGYTAWDCTSPAFLREDASGVTLCIPTAFCSYTGEALDKKTPLLRSMEAINKQAVRMLHLFGKKEVKRVDVCVGAEQEYFLIDREKYLKRDDLVYTGRTLFGARPPKGQEMDDHYFGTIKERVSSFMHELNEELWKLGIYAKTQHNEAAPAQHELAPIFSTVNIETDHNQLVMECMKKIAARHGLTCLLHEKPFAGVNGSGKHNNWSLVTDTGENLMKPGKKPHENMQFLLFLAAVIKATDEHAELIRLAASCPGNDYRLGGAEAPPTIVSIFIGEQLEDILAQLIANGKATSSKERELLRIGVSTMPYIKKDVNDRNRTSTFAFTGNKFELRMVGSSMSIADANTVLNTIVAESLSQMADELEKADNFDDAVLKLICRTINEHKRVIFDGNGYSKEWVEEAERRGLPNKISFVDAIEALNYGDTVRVFEKHGVLSKAELQARAEINYEFYSKTTNIEANTMIEMASRKFIPAAIKYAGTVADAINSISTALDESEADNEREMLGECLELIGDARRSLKRLSDNVNTAARITNEEEKAHYFRDYVVKAMQALRESIDALELQVDAELWPVPTYGELIFEV